MEGRTILGVTAAAVAAAIGISTAAKRNDAGEIMEAGSVGAFEVRVGDCFDDGAFESVEISEVPAMPCAQPHDNEVYAVFDLTGEWPGQERVGELASEGCLDRFAGAIGKDYESSVIEYTTIHPTEGSWRERDDREVLCVGYHMEFEKLTGTIRGSGLQLSLARARVVSSNGGYQGESNRTEWRVNGNANADRVSPTWKQSYSANYNRRSNRIDLDDRFGSPLNDVVNNRM